MEHDEANTVTLQHQCLGANISYTWPVKIAHERGQQVTCGCCGGTMWIQWLAKQKEEEEQ